MWPGQSRPFGAKSHLSPARLAVDSGTGCDQTDAQKTRSLFDRYNVCCDGDLRGAWRRVGHTDGRVSPEVARSGETNRQNR